MKTAEGREVSWTWDDLMRVYSEAVRKLPFRNEGVNVVGGALKRRWRGETPIVRPGQNIGVHGSDVNLVDSRVVKNGRKID